jgi:hypothetical protein
MLKPQPPVAQTTHRRSQSQSVSLLSSSATKGSESPNFIAPTTLHFNFYWQSNQCYASHNVGEMMLVHGMIWMLKLIWWTKIIERHGAIPSNLGDMFPLLRPLVFVPNTSYMEEVIEVNWGDGVCVTVIMVLKARNWLCFIFMNQHVTVIVVLKAICYVLFLWIVDMKLRIDAM